MCRHARRTRDMKVRSSVARVSIRARVVSLCTPVSSRRRDCNVLRSLSSLALLVLTWLPGM
jgi:hypothetical protein